MIRTQTAVAASAVAGMLALSAASAIAAEDFYKGKTITIHTSGAGTYEAYARLFAKYMPKYIPGEPTMVAKQMSGASGLKATNYLYNVAAKDGTEIAGVHGHLLTLAMFNPQGVQFDPNKFNWLGSATKELYLAYMWNATTPVKSMQEAKVKESIVGGQAVGSMPIDIAILANTLIGTKFKIVTGYAGSAETKLAVERGELHGHVGTPLTTMMGNTPEWITEKKVTVIAQFGQSRHPLLPDAPLLTDFVENPDDNKALKLFLARQETGKPYMAPPGVPPERVAILRKAWQSSMTDPEFLADAKKAKLDVDGPLTGEEVEKFLAVVNQTPPAAAKRINDIFNAYTEKK
jgi:tripartite-type tricarboxylate transporter receptor subunit TctC